MSEEVAWGRYALQGEQMHVLRTGIVSAIVVVASAISHLIGPKFDGRLRHHLDHIQSIPYHCQLSRQK